MTKKNEPVESVQGVKFVMFEDIPKIMSTEEHKRFDVEGEPDGWQTMSTDSEENAKFLAGQRKGARLYRRETLVRYTPIAKT